MDAYKEATLSFQWKGCTLSDREGLSSLKVLLRSESCQSVETRGNELERQEVAVRIWDA